MRIDASDLAFRRLDGAVPAAVAEVNEAQWLEVAKAVAADAGRLVALWGSDRRADGEGYVVYSAYAAQDGLAKAASHVGVTLPATPPRVVSSVTMPLTSSTSSRPESSA